MRRFRNVKGVQLSLVYKKGMDLLHNIQNLLLIVYVLCSFRYNRRSFKVYDISQNISSRIYFHMIPVSVHRWTRDTRTSCLQQLWVDVRYITSIYSTGRYMNQERWKNKADYLHQYELHINLVFQFVRSHVDNFWFALKKMLCFETERVYFTSYLCKTGMLGCKIDSMQLICT